MCTPKTEVNTQSYRLFQPGQMILNWKYSISLTEVEFISEIKELFGTLVVQNEPKNCSVNENKPSKKSLQMILMKFCRNKDLKKQENLWSTWGFYSWLVGKSLFHNWTVLKISIRTNIVGITDVERNCKYENRSWLDKKLSSKAVFNFLN